MQLKLEDLKVLRRSPDLLNNCKTGQGQLQLIMKHILFYHIWGLQPFWSSNLNNLSSVISEKRCLDRYEVAQMSGLIFKVTGQLDIWYFYKTILSLGLIFLTGIMILAKTVIEK